MSSKLFMPLKGKTIVITGASRGVGLQLLKELNTHNTIIVIARQSTHLNTLKERYEDVFFYSADLSKESEYPSLVEQVLKQHKRIDVLINNAAVQHTESLLDKNFSYETIGYETRLNFTAVCSLSYLFLPALLSGNKPALILNINSGLALSPKTQSAIYCACKSAMHSFSLSLSYQLEHTQVRVIQAMLPLVDTDMTQDRAGKKMPVETCVKQMYLAIETGKNTYIGKAKLLRFIYAFAPFLAQRLLKNAH